MNAVIDSERIPDVRITFIMRCAKGVWSIYRNGRALHRSRDEARIRMLAVRLAYRESAERLRPVKLVTHRPDQDEPTTEILIDDKALAPVEFDGYTHLGS